MLIAAKDKQEIRKVKPLLSKEFELRDFGATKKILRMEIFRNGKTYKLYLSQIGYIKKVLHRFTMQNTKLVSTQLATHFRLSSSHIEKVLHRFNMHGDLSHMRSIAELVDSWQFLLKKIKRQFSGFLDTCIVL